MSGPAAHDNGGPLHPEGWMVSYADMVTILLAMLIVLTALGRDQTGTLFQKTKEHYQQHRGSFGVPGVLDGAQRPLRLDHLGPQYIYRGPDDGVGRDSGSAEGGPPDGQRTVDGEQARFQYFLRELSRVMPLDKLPRVVGQVGLDCFEPLNRTAPYLTPKHHAFLAQVLPILQRGRYQAYVVVWPTTPGQASWTQAGVQAVEVVDEIARQAQLDAPTRARLIPLSQPWRHRHLERPKLSLLICKSE